MSVLLWILLCLVLLAGLYLFLIAPGRKRPTPRPSRAGCTRTAVCMAAMCPKTAWPPFPAQWKQAMGLSWTYSSPVTASWWFITMPASSAYAARICASVTSPLRNCAAIRCRMGRACRFSATCSRWLAGRVPLIVEVKHHGGAARNAASALQQLGAYGGPYCVESFHPLAMRYFRLHAPDVMRGQLAMGGARQPGETRVHRVLCAQAPAGQQPQPSALCGLFLPGGSYAGHVADAPLLSSPACRLDSAQSGGAGRRAGAGIPASHLRGLHPPAGRCPSVLLTSLPAKFIMNQPLAHSRGR